MPQFTPTQHNNKKKERKKESSGGLARIALEILSLSYN
jgi:hypothetical protein